MIIIVVNRTTRARVSSTSRRRGGDNTRARPVNALLYDSYSRVNEDTFFTDFSSSLPPQKKNDTRIKRINVFTWFIHDIIYYIENLTRSTLIFNYEIRHNIINYKYDFKTCAVK